MILRKPYAFLIKNFRLIHTILSFCMIYLIYKSYKIYSFFNEFIASNSLITDYNMSDKLFNLYMFLIPWIIIVILIILLVVMFRKKKPKLFYFINIVIYIATIVIYNYLYNTITYMQTNIISAQNVKLASDIAFIINIVQLIGAVISIIRSLGLDLKKFDFGKDLMELDIDELDDEEFEVNVDIDSNSIKRNFKKRLRYARYIYVENRTIINTVIIVLLATISFVIYININIYNAHYNEKEVFATTDYALSINKSYITRKDSKGANITKNNTSLLVLEVKIKPYGKTNAINLAKTEISIKNKVYYPTTKYINSLVDLGETYDGQTLQNEFENYLLVYEIPTTELSNKVIFRYLNGFNIKTSSLKPTYIKVELAPLSLDNNIKTSNISPNELVIMNDKTLGNTTITINSLEINKQFINNYNFCLTKNDCYKSIEYIKPNLNTNYDKALLKVEGYITLDKNINSTSLRNLYSVINHFGQIEYIKDGKTYKINNFTRVTPKKYQNSSIYYLEIDSSVLEADEVYFIIRVRNYEYRFNVFKKDVNE